MEVVLFICLIGDPTQCKDQTLEHKVQTENPFRCSTVSVPMIAQWAGEHPQWEIKKWRCVAQGGRDM
jgi:hypothetical protein